MEENNRRQTDALRAVDRLLEAHLQQSALGARPLANLATAMAVDYSDADRATLLLDDGDGLKPVIALAKAMRAASRTASVEDRAVRDAISQRTMAVRGNQAAAPILVGNDVRGVLALEVDSEPLDPGTGELAAAVATRIGTILRSAELMAEVSRRTLDMEALETLGARLSVGKLQGEHLERAVENVLQATHSSLAILALVDERGELLDRYALSEEDDDLEQLCERLVGRLAEGAVQSEVGDVLGDWHLFQPFRADLVPEAGVEELRRPAGFLAIRRSSRGPYHERESSFFRALAHLVEGALARSAYFAHAAEDPLTQTGSRLALQIALAEAQTAALATGQPFSVILVDLDNFKALNDEHGHLVGDQVLQGVAAVLRSRLRAQDSVARYGGDEFVVILPATAPEQAARLARELGHLAAETEHGELGVTISLSMGVDVFDPADGSFMKVLERADRALYEAKRAGRNRVSVYGGGLTA